MTGHLGSTDLAAVAIGLAVSVSVFVALVGVMQGLSPIAGHHYGAGHHEKIGFELHQTIWLAILLAIIGRIDVLHADVDDADQLHRTRCRNRDKLPS